jgi:hypothetical protein
LDGGGVAGSVAAASVEVSADGGAGVVELAGPSGAVGALGAELSGLVLEVGDLGGELSKFMLAGRERMIQGVEGVAGGGDLVAVTEAPERVVVAVEHGLGGGLALLGVGEGGDGALVGGDESFEAPLDVAALVVVAVDRPGEVVFGLQ